MRALHKGGAKIITLDRILSRYGAEAKGVRDDLRRSVAAGVERIWPSESTREADLAGVEEATGMEDVYDKIRELAPQNESQEYLKSQALQLSADLMQSRWMMIEQSQNSLPTAVSVCAGILARGSLRQLRLVDSCEISRRISALFICALSMSGAIFLIMELNRPLEGTIKVSSAPLQKALSIIDK